jgi:hypothetical protein
MKTWTSLYLLLFFLIAISSASATGTLGLERVTGSQFLVDGLMSVDSTPDSELAQAGALSSGTGVAASILEGMNTVGLAKTDVAADNGFAQAEMLTTGFSVSELATGEPRATLKILLWLMSLAGLGAIVASTRMIKHNKKVTDDAVVNCKCSSCFSSKTLASRWRWYELPLWMLSARPIRCFSCQRRQFAWAWQRKQGTVRPAHNLVPAR